MRRRTGVNRRTWRKAVNLMDVVRDLLERSCGFGSKHPAYDILSAHPDSIALLYNVARTFRAFLSLLPQREIFKPSDGATDKTNTGSSGVRDGSDERTDGGKNDQGSNEEGDGRPKQGHQIVADACKKELAPVQTNIEDDTPVAGSIQVDACQGCESAGAIGTDDPKGGTNSGGDDGPEDAEGTAAVAPLIAENGVDITAVEGAVTSLFELLMMDVATAHNLKHVTCSVLEKKYWEEHIGGENDSTERFGTICMTGDDDVDKDDGSGEGVESGEEDEEEDFGM